MRFETFDQVVNWYNTTKPVISKNHKRENDVRPIGSRSRKWERIKKIDDNTYALCDGNYGNTIYATSTPEQAEFENMMAPIVWMRREDGDYIRLRNHSAHCTSVTRYNFLAYNTPTGIRFDYNQQGKHWIEAKTSSGWEKFPLPKGEVRFDWTNKKVINGDDKTYLMFRVNGDGTFTRVGDKIEVVGTRIDKELKAKMRPALDEFYNYCAAIAPLVNTDWDARREYMEQINDCHTHGRSWLRCTSDISSDLVRAVVETPEHPLRVAVAAFVINDIGGKRPIENELDVRYVKTNYNRVMNKALNLYKTEEV
jgi:hypothetical protein